MADKETINNFPTMGESIIGSVVNISGQRSPYTKVAGKQGFGKSGDGGMPHKGNRSHTEIKNANGPACKIVTKISYPNASESGLEGRNVKRVQGPYSFELARAQASNTKNV